MRRANLKVSDQSGIVFDYTFIFEKPVILIRFIYHRTRMYASDQPGELWEATVQDIIGFQIGKDDVNSLPGRIQNMVSTAERQQNIRLVKEQSLFNPGEAGKTATRQVL